MQQIQGSKFTSSPQIQRTPFWRVRGLILGCFLMAACQPSTIRSSKEHFLRPTNPPISITRGPEVSPAVVVGNATDPANGVKKEEVYTITVTEMPVRDLLFALSRDANKNIDVYPGITGRVTLSAYDQTLPQILDRVAKQVGIRYEIKDNSVIVSPDLPYLKIYQVDYVNTTRDSVSSNKISTQLSTTGLPTTDLVGGSAAGSSESNQSSTTLTTSTTNRFWKTLTQNIQAIIAPGESVETSSDSTPVMSAGGGAVPVATGLDEFPGLDLMGGEGGGAGAAALPNAPGKTVKLTTSSSVVAINPEAGIISVYASSRQHERIKMVLDSVLENVHRQVLIESTVVEVTLNDRFQEGVNWNKVFVETAGVTLSGLSSSGSVSTGIINGAAGNFFGIDAKKGGSAGSVDAALKMLETFGNTKVLSSPKIMAINNQPALLKVVQNRVFFTLESNATPNNTTTTAGATATPPSPQTAAVFNTKIHTVPVGLVMSVTPQISDEDIVSLSVRPTISRIVRWVTDPNPALVPGNTLAGLPLSSQATNQIPEVEVKEMETVLRVHSGQVAVMGGLMQDEVKQDSAGLPFFGRIPGIGSLFSEHDKQASKTELVVFLRPVVMTYGKPRELSANLATGGAAARNHQDASPSAKSIDHKQTPPVTSSKSATPAKPAATAKPTLATKPSAPAKPAATTKPSAPAKPAATTVPATPAEAPAPAVPAPSLPSNGRPITPPPKDGVGQPSEKPRNAPAAAGAVSDGAYLDFTAPGGLPSNYPRKGANPGGGNVGELASPPARPALPPDEPAPVSRVEPGLGDQPEAGKFSVDSGSVQQAAPAYDVHQQVAATGPSIQR